MSTKPAAVAQVPRPAIETVMPVPELSVMFQDKRTIWFPPTVTELGFAEKLLMVGAGQELAVTVVCAVDVVPQPLVTVIV